jgi:hypothetical protein
MCEPIICGTVLAAYALVFGGMGLASHNSNERSRIRHKIGDLVWEYRGLKAVGETLSFTEREILETKLRLGWSARRVVKAAHNARDRILFADTPPNVHSAGKYVRAQKSAGKVDIRLLYVLDPELLLGVLTQGQGLMMSSDLSSCRDGTYRTSVEFVANYRNLVGEQAFQVRRTLFERDNNLVGTQPWYFGRPDYESRLETTVGKDSF